MKKLDAYRKALKDCEKIAQEEFKAAVKFSKRCDQIVNNLNNEFSDIAWKAEQVTAKGQVAAKGLADIQSCLGAGYELLRAKQTKALEQQKESLKSFSVMLFGRTMAGKSTIREAITGGDGSTIGMGAQRTTRDVRQYDWNHLRIIDTPGFGAYNGEEDTEIARSILEQSDVVLFLLSDDSIQESTFTELKYAYQLNKPLIFVVNVKKNLEKNVHRKKAIKDPDSYIYNASDLEGHKERLRNEAAKLGMNPRYIHIVPIHAQAAFLSTQEAYSDQKEDLYRVSRMDNLLALLTDEITHKGRTRRVQTLLGSTLTHTDELETLIRSQKESVKGLLKEYANTQKRVYIWHERQSKRVPDKIEKDVGRVFAPLMKSISSFVDDNIQSNSFGNRLDDHIASFDLEERCKNVANNIAEELAADLEQFNRDMAKNIELGGKLNMEGSKRSFDPFDYKRMNGWTAAGLGVLSAIAFANSWNPIGWGLAAAGFVFGLFQMLSDSKTKKLQMEKRSRTKEIRDEIEVQRDNSIKEITKWFHKDIERKQILQVKSELKEVCMGLEKFIQSLEKAFLQLDQLEHDINERYLLRSMDIVASDKYQKPQFKRIVRQPGYACYFTVTNHFKEPELLSSLQTLLGERVRVVYENSVEKMLYHMLGLRKDRARVEGENGEYFIFAKEEDLGRIIGKQGRNIMLAAAICNIKLSAKPMHEMSEVCH